MPPKSKKEFVMSMNPIQGVNVIVAVGSVDGMAGTAACIRHAKDPTIQVVFTQAFQVHFIDVAKWPKNSKVGFIDLAVNNEGQTPNKQLTIDFVNKVYNAGHSILFIADNHGKLAWKEVLEVCGHKKEELAIQPKDRLKYSSSCAILEKAFGTSADFYTHSLLNAGDEGNRMIYNSPLGEIFNNSTKSNLVDPARRPYVVKHLAEEDTADTKIQGWMDEYVEMKNNLPKIMESGRDLGNGLFQYDGAIGIHDASAIFKEAYKKSPVAILTGTNVFLKEPGVSIATDRKDLDVLKIIQGANISAKGTAFKANIAIEHLPRAIEAIRNVL
jgi:hypothetical protein